MSGKSLADLSRKMRDIDIAMLSTHGDDGAIASRPMSNNRDVEYDGDSYYFTWEGAHMIPHIERDRKVSLAFQGQDRFMVAVEGEAELIRDRSQFEAHWTPDLDKWFKNGIETEGIVLIKVHALNIHYWDGEEEGEIEL
jgi:general stress protein 26